MALSIEEDIRTEMDQQHCHHCGEECLEHDIVFEQKHFCCQGCCTVFRILQENDLEIYYQLEENPGLRISDKAELEFLDNPDIRSELIDFSEGNRSRVSFRIPAIHCSSCIYLLENLPRIEASVLSSQVNFGRKQVDILFDEEQLSLKELVALLHRIGYEPVIRAGGKEEIRQDTGERTLAWKIGLAGFCFGNIMLLSFPEYVSGGSEIPARYMAIFNWISVGLSLPVLFYSGRDYFLSAFKSLRERYLGIDVPIVLGMLALFFRSIYEIAVLGEAGYLDSLAGLVFFLLIGKWFQGRTYEVLAFDRDYRSFFPLSARRISNGKAESVPIAQLTEGDRVELRNEEIIPADALLLSDEAQVDYSFVTGESLPVRKKAGELLYAGGRMAGGSARIEVRKAVDQSYLTRLWNNPVFGEKKESRTTGLINRIAHYFTIAVLSISTLAAIGWWMMAGAGEAAMVFTSVLIVACPCALALSAPFTFGHAMRIFGRNGFYLKHSHVVERLNEANRLVFDKTGTLTRTDRARIEWEGTEMSGTHQSKFHALFAQSMHPLSRLLEKELPAAGRRELTDFKESRGEGISAIIDGRQLISGSREWLLKNAVALPRQLTESASTQVLLAMDGRYLGRFKFRNVYRDGALAQLCELENEYPISIISGDGKGEAESLRNQLGANVELLFEQRPEDKLNYLNELGGKDRAIMVGDGLNDAGALQQSHVGIALTEDINQFSPACDAILDAGKFSQLKNLLGYAKESVRILRESLAFSLLYNTIGLGFAIAGLLTPLVAAILMPVSSISVVLYATLMTKFRAKKYGLS